jgi:NADH-quinone oxidoreductase subunit A
LTLWPLAVFTTLAVGVVASMLLLSTLLGERIEGRERGEPYESGMPPTGSARTPYSAQFYLVAVFFLIFDLEAVFLFAWAVAAVELGWSGYVEAVVFIAVLLAALFYLWKEGALDWGPAFNLLRGEPGEQTASSTEEEGQERATWTGG